MNNEQRDKLAQNNLQIQLELYKEAALNYQYLLKVMQQKAAELQFILSEEKRKAMAPLQHVPDIEIKELPMNKIVVEELEAQLYAMGNLNFTKLEMKTCDAKLQEADRATELAQKLDR